MHKVELKIKNDVLQELCRGHIVVIQDFDLKAEYHLTFDLEDEELLKCVNYLKKTIEEKLN